jgi:hypothetical protein
MTKPNPENERQENGNETTAIHNHMPMKSRRRSPHFWARDTAVKWGPGSGCPRGAEGLGAEWIFALPAEGANSGCVSEPLLLRRGGFAMFMLARLVGGSFVAL